MTSNECSPAVTAMMREEIVQYSIHCSRLCVSGQPGCSCERFLCRCQYTRGPVTGGHEARLWIDFSLAALLRTR